jgi:hypothetical protein
MWCNGHKFHIKNLDDKKKISNSMIIAIFQVTNVSFRSGRHPKIFENRYYGYLKDIIECDFNSFNLVLFEVKWYRLQMNECDLEKTVIEIVNGFTMVNTRTFESCTKTYVVPSQCEQVIYSKVPGILGWSYIFIYDPRGSLIKYNVPGEDDIEEGEDAEEHEVDVILDEEVEEVQPYVDNNYVLNNDIDDDIMIKNDIYDDVGMANPLNINFEPNNTYVDLDEEEDQ